jgi:hypothetical protein
VPCSKRCENGGKCVPASEEDEGGSETCSCTKAVVDGNPYAGLRCEYGATKSCMTLGSLSKHSFCTNGGDCADIVLDNQLHVDCICPTGYEGSHCEYLEGGEGAPPTPTTAASSSTTATVSGAEMASTDGSSSSSRVDKIVFVLVIAFAAVIAMLLLAFVVRARRRRAEAKRRERQAREATEEFSMIPTDDHDPETEII